MRLATTIAAAATLCLTACATTSQTAPQAQAAPTAAASVTAPAPAAAPASAAATAATSPAGQWALDLTVQSSPEKSTLTLQQAADGSWKGSLATTDYGSYDFTSITVANGQMEAAFSTEGGDATMKLTFDGNSVHGDWSMSSDGSKVTGTRS